MIRPKTWVGADFETHFSSDYTLKGPKGLATSEYIRDDRFEAMCVSLRSNTQKKAKVYYGQDIKKALGAIDWATTGFLAHNCVTPDHEVLTSEGWVRFDALHGNETIAQWNPKNTEASFTPYTLVQHSYDGEMLQFSNSKHQGIYTPDHRVYWRTYDTPLWRETPASELKTRSINNTLIPKTASHLAQFNTLISLSIAETQLLEAFRADGSWNKDKKGICYGLRFKFKKERKIVRLKTILHTLNIQPRINTDQTGATTLSIGKSDLTQLFYTLLGPGKEYNKNILQLSPTAQQTILTEAYYWDGSHSRNSKRGYCFSTASAKTAHWLSTIASLNGHSFTYKRIANNRGFTKNSQKQFWLHVGTVTKNTYCKLGQKPKQIHYRGTVYCVQVPTKAFLIRRNNCIWVTGNCAFDGLILSHHYGHIPCYYYDTMSMARPIVGHSIGAGLDEVLRYYNRTGKLDGGAALEAVKGKYLIDLTPVERRNLGAYCDVDVDEMVWLFEQWADFPEDEMDLIHLCINMFANPILDVDKPRAKAERNRAIKERHRLFDRVSHLIDLAPAQERIRKKKADRLHLETLDEHATLMFTLQKALRSGNDFADALEQQAQVVPWKKNPKGKDIYAFAKTDLAFIAMADSPKPEVRDLQQAKLEASSSINITRATSLLQRVEKPGWRLPIMLNYCKAHTFRYSGGDKLNPQNFTARGRNGSELRKSIIAPKGYKVIVADSSQIEARKNAWFWDHHALLEVFRKSDRGEGRDPYCHLADKIYNQRVTKAEDEMRFVGKVGVLGLGYQMGGDKYQYTLESGQMGPPVVISRAGAARVVAIYRKENKPIVDGWHTLENFLSIMVEGGTARHKGIIFEGDEVHMPNGLSLHFPELSGIWIDWKDRYGEFEYWNTSGNAPHYTNLYGGKFNENIIQSLARIVVGQQMLRIAEEYRVVMMSHDEVVYLAPTKQAEKALEFGLEQMSWVPDWCQGIPLSAEGKIADYYSK